MYAHLRLLYTLLSFEDEQKGSPGPLSLVRGLERSVRGEIARVRGFQISISPCRIQILFFFFLFFRAVTTGDARVKVAVLSIQQWVYFSFRVMRYLD